MNNEWIVRVAGKFSAGTYGPLQCTIYADSAEEARILGAERLGRRPEEVLATNMAEVDFTGEGMGVIGHREI